MAKRHLRLREPHWRVGLLINGLGSARDGVVPDRHRDHEVHAWRVGRHRPRADHGLRVDPVGPAVRDGDSASSSGTWNGSAPTICSARRSCCSSTRSTPRPIHALQYAKTIRARRRPRRPHRGRTRCGRSQLETAWSAAGLSDVPLKILRGGGDGGEPAGRVHRRACREDRDVNVLIPVSHETSARERISEARAGCAAHQALLPYEQRACHAGARPPRRRASPVVRRARQARSCGWLHAAGTRPSCWSTSWTARSLRAVRYPLTLGATEVWAVHAAVDPDRAGCARAASGWTHGCRSRST